MQWNHLPKGINKVEMYSILYIGLMDLPNKLDETGSVSQKAEKKLNHFG